MPKRGSTRKQQPPEAGVSRMVVVAGGILVLLMCALWLSCHEFARRMQPEQDTHHVEDPLDDAEQPREP